MSTATAVAQRSPTGAAATSPGYQGSSAPSTKPTERPASTEMESQVAPSSEPAEGKKVDVSADIASDGDADAGGIKAQESDDATPSKEVRKKAHIGHCYSCEVFVLSCICLFPGRVWYDRCGGCCGGSPWTFENVTREGSPSHERKRLPCGIAIYRW